MLTLLFRYEPSVLHDDRDEKFKSVVFNWGKLNKNQKLAQIFGTGCCEYPLILNQNNAAFEIKLSDPDVTLSSSTISSEDLVFALDLDPSEWTVWKLL